MPSFLMTPRSILPSWLESPKAPQPKPDSANKTSEIQSNTFDEPRQAESEQRDGACCGTEAARQGEEPGAADVAANAKVTAEPGTPTKFECDYDLNASNIFMSLQKKEWENTIKLADESPIEARTWVTRREKGGKLRWRLLPLHAAIIFKAPEKVVESLLAAYPKGAQSKDDQGMLPLHLAFRHGSTEATVNLLLVAFPQSVNVEDRKGRIPLVLAQAAASANKEAFLRALERGPTYYANAAAATERANVTAEQKALFDAKLVEIKQNHQNDIKSLQEERDGLSESVSFLQSELDKQKRATKVLVDHINSLEHQLRNKDQSEHFLAVKAATLDTTLKEMEFRNEHSAVALAEEVEALKVENFNLISRLNDLNAIEEERVSKRAPPAEFEKLNKKISKQEEEIESMKMECASSQARVAVLEAQLKSKIENEHELASQVSRLASRLAASAADSNSQNTMYAKRVQTLEAEREKLRATINDLGKKLLKVSQFMNKMTAKSADNTKKMEEEAKEKEAAKLSKLEEESTSHELLIRSALAEREHMAQLLKKQEEEMERSAKQHREMLARLEEMKKKSLESTKGVSHEKAAENPFEEMQAMMSSVLDGMPQTMSDDSDPTDLVDNVMKNVAPTPKASGSSPSPFSDDALTSSSLRENDTLDSEEDAQKCLEQALRALEENRDASNSDQAKLQSMSADSDDTELSCNPSDEMSPLK